MENNQRVAIIIVTYNSEKWIIETLESVKNQTYKELELVVSDDASCDKTVEICKKWIKKNNNRFRNISIVESLKNEGVTKNINKGIKATKSDWIKPIAGDDILLKDCIEKNINYCLNNKVENVFSKSIDFKSELKKENILNDKRNYKYFKKDAKKQFKQLLKECFVVAPTGFFKKSLIEKMGYFDEKYITVEDYPMWLKLTENGIRLNFLEEATVYYRVHFNSLSSKSEKVINESMYDFRKKIFNEYIKNRVGLLFRYSEKLKYIRYDAIIKKGNKTKWSFITFLTYLLDPYSYIKIFLKTCNKVKN